MARKKLSSTSIGDAERSPTPPFAPSDYNAVVGSAKLLTIQLAKNSFEIKGDFYDDSKERTLDATKDELAAYFDPESSTISGAFRFCITARHGKKHVLKASADYLVMYSVHAGASEEAAVAFCKRVGLFAAYPYFRALVAHLTWAANADLPPLPVIATRGAPIRATSAPPKSVAPPTRQRKRRNMVQDGGD